MSAESGIMCLRIARTTAEVDQAAAQLAACGEAGINALVEMLYSIDPREVARAIHALTVTHLIGSPALTPNLADVLLRRPEAWLCQLVLPHVMQHAASGSPSASTALERYAARGSAEAAAFCDALAQLSRIGEPAAAEARSIPFVEAS